MTIAEAAPRAQPLPLLVTVGLFRDPWHAHLFRMRLEAEGIPAFVAFQFHIGNDWLYSTALGGTRVQVWRHLARDAVEILARVRNGECRAELVDMFGDIDDPRCPHCGSTELKRRRSVAMIAMVILLLFSFALPAWGWVYICKKCGTKFESP